MKSQGRLRSRLTLVRMELRTGAEWAGSDVAVMHTYRVAMERAISRACGSLEAVAGTVSRQQWAPS